MRILLLAATALPLMACVPPPSVSAFNGDSVTVRTPGGIRSAASDAEALRLCQRAGRGTSEFLSSKPVPGTYDQEHLYACLD